MYRSPQFPARACRRSEPSSGAWGGAFRGALHTTPPSTGTSASPSPRKSWRPAIPTTSAPPATPAKKRPASAFLQKTSRELSSTRIPRLDAAPKICSRFTHSLIARPRDAMKPAFHFRWLGSATTTATWTAIWLTRIGLTGPHLMRRMLRQGSVLPLPKQTLPAATAKTTNLFFIDSNQPDDTELLVAGVTGSVKK